MFLIFAARHGGNYPSGAANAEGVDLDSVQHSLTRTHAIYDAILKGLKLDPDR
jgi:hypothetical protein